jgi:glycine/D-amino acid oxidase-like deaminating enzyme/nitrite reductase/ring-hydroxylating ferredoxin subunit
MPTTSYWRDTSSVPSFRPLDSDMTVDVAVIGAGMTGAMSAYLLKRAGLKVALLEKSQCARGDTEFTSAHLTYVTDLRITELVRKLGRDHAQAVWEAGEAAIQLIQDTIQREHIACDFSRVPGFISSAMQSSADERDQLRDDTRQVQELGFAARFTESVPLTNRAGIQFPNQARFHPLAFLREILGRIPGDGSFVFEHSEVKEIQNDPLRIIANGKCISAGQVIIATDVPLQGMNTLFNASLFQTKIHPYTSYVVGAKVRKGTVPDVLLWDTNDPYFYFRLAPGEQQDEVIFGGFDHKTGQQEDESNCFPQLEEVLREILPRAEVSHRWSGQVIESVDGLPFIGENASHQFIATGFSGNGLTFGTVAAMMACDWVLGRKNPWVDLFSPSRKKLSALWNYVRENLDYPYYMVKDRLSLSKAGTVDEIKAGEGRVVKVNGQRLALYRDRSGALTSLSPVCPHLGCLVHWNDAETTWDCPCHGSRFRATGEVLAGPAESNLEPVSLDQESSKLTQ